VWTFGDNGSGQLGNNSTTDSKVPIQVSGLTGIVAVAAGGNHLSDSPKSLPRSDRNLVD
jgi:alpha-tubulin suppressor-like RCC1 family protein